MADHLKLYDYFRSSASYRVRIALEWKGLAYESIAVDLRTGMQRAAAYRSVNPQELVPALADDGRLIAQSLAILEYLEETRPEPALLPVAPLDRARVRQLAALIACDVHPLDNLRVLQYLEHELGVDEAKRLRWYQHWIIQGLTAYESLLGDPRTSLYSHGDVPTFADVCLVPQVYNARRFHVDLAPFPKVVAIDARCRALGAFTRAAPEATEARSDH